MIEKSLHYVLFFILWLAVFGFLFLPYLLGLLPSVVNIYFLWIAAPLIMTGIDYYFNEILE